MRCSICDAKMELQKTFLDYDEDDKLKYCFVCPNGCCRTGTFSESSMARVGAK